MSEPLSPELVLAGYRAGVFPMADFDGRIFWFSPDPRCIFDLENFHIPHTLRKTVRRSFFEIRFDTAFDRVIAICADRPEGTWISPLIMSVYCELHRQGHTHSVEAWQDNQLVGGLYGLAIGGAFFGESMFHAVTDASKVALVALVKHLRQRGYTLLDTQWHTPHLARFGTVEIPREEYLERLRQATQLPCRFVDA
ncbi:MAG: leucyl/phenylalanyl-tRNA--protein transferase [Planctomycetota bacterium]